MTQGGDVRPRQVSRWRDDRFERTVFLVAADTVDDWPLTPPWVSAAFGLFIASDQEIDAGTVAERAIAQGLALVAAWGPRCEHVEDIFDEERVGDGTRSETDETVIMTTSHPDESLSEALDYFLVTSFPADAYVESCQAWVVFAIGSVGAKLEGALHDRGAHRLDATP